MPSSLTGVDLQMGHATAESVVRAGLNLVPFSFTGESEAVVVGNVAVSGIPVQLVGPEERQKALEEVLDKHHGLIVIDFTLPEAVNCKPAVQQCRTCCQNNCCQLPFLM